MVEPVKLEWMLNHWFVRRLWKYSIPLWQHDVSLETFQTVQAESTLARNVFGVRVFFFWRQ